MKLSELIKILTQTMHDYGDVDVIVAHDNFTGNEKPDVDTVFDPNDNKTRWVEIS